MIWYLPLEHLDKRYTTHLDVQLQREFCRQGLSFHVVEGQVLTSSIEVGAFLDAFGTNYYKASQLMQVASLFQQRKIRSGDAFFISDLWFPGLEMIPYMSYFPRRKVFVTGLLHAGSFTETDYVAGMTSWAADLERSWLSFIDLVFLGSENIQAELVLKKRVTRFGTLRVTGLPFDPADCYAICPYREWKEKENIVVFAGRLDDEKQPWLFNYLERGLRGKAQFIRTMDLGLDKQGYYDLLSRSKVFFSSALQENFGYAALEAAAYGLSLVVPNRLVYPEFYPFYMLYDSLEQSQQMVEKFLAEDHSQEVTQIAQLQSANVQKIVSCVAQLL